MKVKLATQLLSKSVTYSLDFCREKLKIADFKKLLATAKFIHILYDLFDIIISRNFKLVGYKQPLNLSNKIKAMGLLTKVENYTKGLQTLQGDCLVQSDRKTGFIGLLVCIKSTKSIVYVNIQV